MTRNLYLYRQHLKGNLCWTLNKWQCISTRRYFTMKNYYLEKSCAFSNQFLHSQLDGATFNTRWCKNLKLIFEVQSQKKKEKPGKFKFKCLFISLFYHNFHLNVHNFLISFSNHILLLFIKGNFPSFSLLLKIIVPVYIYIKFTLN